MTGQRLWLWVVTAVEGTFCSQCVLYKGFAPPEPFSPRWPCPKMYGLSGAGPRPGVQHCGQQGVPLPDKNRFLSARATQITFSASLPFLVNVAPDSALEAFNFALLGPSPRLYNYAVHTAVFTFFLLLTVGSALP